MLNYASSNSMAVALRWLCQGMQEWGIWSKQLWSMSICPSKTRRAMGTFPGSMCGAVFVCAMRMPSSLKILHICNLWESRTMNSYDLSTMSAQEKSGTIHLPKSAAFTMDCGRYRGEHTSSKLKLRALFCGHSWMCMNQGMVDSREDIKLMDTNMFPPDNGKKIYREHPIQEES